MIFKYAGRHALKRNPWVLRQASDLMSREFARLRRSIVRARKCSSSRCFAARATFPPYARSRGQGERQRSPRLSQRCVSDHRQVNAAARSDRFLSGRQDSEVPIHGGGDQRHHGHAARRLSKFRLDPLGRSVSPAALALGRLESRSAPGGASRRDRDPDRPAAIRHSGSGTRSAANSCSRLATSTGNPSRLFAQRASPSSAPRSCAPIHPPPTSLRRWSPKPASGAIQLRDHRLGDALRLSAAAHRVGLQDAASSISTAWPNAWRMRRSANTGACT